MAGGRYKIAELYEIPELARFYVLICGVHSKRSFSVAPADESPTSQLQCWRVRQPFHLSKAA